MNSLENLNNWANDSIAYPGNAEYSIVFTPSSPSNKTTSFTEDSPFTAPPGTDITTMVSTPDNIEYTIDLSSASFPATVSWGSLPYYATSEIAGTNIFKVVGTIDVDLWEQIKSPIITIPDQSTNFTYTSTITYPDPANPGSTTTKSWTTTASVTASPDLSTPTAWQYTKNSIGTIAGTPTILDTNSGTYTIVLTPSIIEAVYLMSSSGSGGTSTFDGINKTLTITGTKAQVNSHLTAVSFTPATNVGVTFTMSYSLTNPTGKITIKNQALSSASAYAIGIATYVEDTPFSLGYQIKDQSATATSFTISVAQTTPLPSVSPGYFTVNGSNVGNTWTTSNTKANINAANVVYTPPVDYTGTLTFTVNQSKVDNGNTVVQITDDPNNIVNVGTNTEIQNMINRSYYSNTVNSIFSTTTPAITDGPDVGQTYTITLSSSLGKFGNSIANAIGSSSYSFTGNKTACNSEFSNMVFVPNKGTSASGNFTYTQTRGSTLQVNQNLTLTGVVQAFTPSTATFTGNGNWTPTFDQSYYGNVSVLLVGGGGPGGWFKYGSGGSLYIVSGGGGGGQVVEATNLAVSPGTPYPVVVGAAGITGNTNAANVTAFLSSRTNGGSSSAFGYTAAGGIRAISNYEWAAANPGQTMPANGNLLVGGTSGSGYVGGSSYRHSSGAPWATGGGGGAGGVGGSTTNSSIGGAPGAGRTSSLNGVRYGSGGVGAGVSGANSPAVSADTNSNAGKGGAGSLGPSSASPSYNVVGNGTKGIVIIKVT